MKDQSLYITMLISINKVLYIPNLSLIRTVGGEIMIYDVSIFGNTSGI